MKVCAKAIATSQENIAPIVFKGSWKEAPLKERALLRRSSQIFAAGPENERALFKLDYGLGFVSCPIFI